MRIAEINSCNFGSTGNIMLEIAEVAEKCGHTAAVCYPKSRGNAKKQKESDIAIGNRLSRNLHLKLAEITGLNGCFSYFSTLDFLRKLNKFKPDIIHLHNLHNCYVNLPLLFGYIKKHNIKTVWTLHDCWSFTGHCPYFDIAECDKWKTECKNCPQYKGYPKSLFDNSKYMYSLKKKWFTGVENMTIVTPSEWLAGLVKKSYLKDYPVRVINNGIDLSVFKPTESDFRKKYALENKYIVLGVASPWGKRKGFDAFSELAERLDDSYRIVLVGLAKEQKEVLPPNIIGLERTANQTELAKIYTAADVFANPTREEVFGLVNIEALACGTPGVTFETGGSPECFNETCGAVVAKNDIGAMYNEIIRICETKPYSKKMCINGANGFDKNEKFKEYVALYGTLD